MTPPGLSRNTALCSAPCSESTAFVQRVCRASPATAVMSSTTVTGSWAMQTSNIEPPGTPGDSRKYPIHLSQCGSPFGLLQDNAIAVEVLVSAAVFLPIGI